MSPQYDAYSLWETGQANSPKNVRIRRMRQVLPYVLIKWEGREILYNRLYEPLWERDADGVVTRSTERYRFKWCDQKFYSEAGTKTAPWESADVLMKTCCANGACLSKNIVDVSASAFFASALSEAPLGDFEP